jgi:hypothetical protein
VWLCSLPSTDGGHALELFDYTSIIIYSLTLFSLLSLYYRIKKEVLLLYGFSVLRFLGDFETCMAVDNLWTDSNEHPFVQRIREARRQCDISVELFKQWQDDVIKSFKSRNAYALSIDSIADGPIESRTIVEMVHCMTRLVHSHGVTLNHMSDSIASLKGTINDAGGILKKAVDDKVDDVMAGFQNLNLGRGQQTQERHDEDAPAAEAITLSSYTNLMKTGKEMPLLEIAFNWFRYDVRQLFFNEKSTVTDKKEASRLRQHFSAIKSTMHVVIKNLNNYPDEMPSGEPNKIVAWERSLKSEVEAALEKIKPHVKTLNKNNVKALVKEYNNIDFPAGTPEEVKKFFNDTGRTEGGRSKKRSADEAVASESNTNKRQRSI